MMMQRVCVAQTCLRRSQLHFHQATAATAHSSSSSSSSSSSVPEHDILLWPSDRLQTNHQQDAPSKQQQDASSKRHSLHAAHQATTISSWHDTTSAAASRCFTPMCCHSASTFSHSASRCFTSTVVISHTASRCFTSTLLHSHSESRCFSSTSLHPASRCFTSTSTSSQSASISRWPPPPPLPSRRVVFTGLGLVTPLGVGVPTTWRALLAGQTGVRALQEEDLPASHRPLLAQLPCKVAAMVPKAQLEEALERLKEDPRRASPFMLYGMVAAAEALADAGWDPPTHGAEAQASTGVSLGVGMSACAEVADAWTSVAEGRLKKLSPFFVPRILPNMAAGAVSIRWGLNGPNHAVSTACATGLHAIGDAYRMVQRGDAEVMVAGGAEASVDALSLAGFSRARALSTRYSSTPELASRPFDAGRDGFVMGEGAGVVVLEEEGHARARGAHIYAEVRGYGLSGDGHHITQPHPEGLGARLCMQRALASSGLQYSHVNYINAHATSTPQGDDIEAKAISHVWDDALTPHLAVSSTKGATGHLLGAAGAVETVFTILALYHRMAPPTVNLVQPDPDILPGLVGPQAKPLSSASSSAPGPMAAVCNSFGFGGTNACLLVSEA